MSRSSSGVPADDLVFSYFLHVDTWVSKSKLDRAISDAVAAVQQESYRQHDSIWRTRTEVGDLLFALVTQGALDAVTTEAQATRISLTANLVQSSSVVKDLISSGFYWSAAAVLRQCMETLARSIEIRSGRDTARTKSPNVAVLPYRMSKNYGRLSELVHTSGGESLADFAQGSAAPEAATVIPRFREPWARGLLCLHVAQLVTLAREIDLLHRELYPGRQLIDASAALTPIAQALVDAGFWTADR